MQKKKKFCLGSIQRSNIANYALLITLVQKFLIINIIIINEWRRVIGISGSLICSKTLMELIFNTCGEFL